MREASIHAAVAAPIPLLIALFAVRLRRALRAVAWVLCFLLFLTIFYASYFVFCVGCD